MTDLEKVYEKLAGINGGIREVLKASKYEDFDDLSSLNIDYTDSEQLFLLDELRGIMERLEYVHNRVKYLNSPVVYEGRLSKNNQGRYELPNGVYYTSGSMIECLVNDGYHSHENSKSGDYESVPYWIRTSVEHNGTDYYLVNSRNTTMQGLLVRVRK